jgi:hypothetical protein
MPKRTGRPWEPYEDAALLDLIEKRRSHISIGAHLKRTASAVKSRVLTLKQENDKKPRHPKG